MPKYVPKERDVILAYLPGNSQAFLKRIQVYLKTKQKLTAMPPESLPSHQTKVENELIEDPNNILKRLELSVFHEMQGEFSEATSELESVIDLLLNREEDCSDLYIRLGALYECQSDYDNAHSAYEEGQKLGLKLRPAICLRKLPPTYQEFLVCGLSTQKRLARNFDETIKNGDNGLRLVTEQSVIRLGFLGRVRIEEAVGRIGSISVPRHRRLLKKLGEYLINKP